MPAPPRGLGFVLAGVRLVHAPVAGSHSQMSEAPFSKPLPSPNRPPNMTRTLRVSSKAADCK